MSTTIDGKAILVTGANRGIGQALVKGEEDIFPDPMSATLADSWQAGPAKALERQNAALLQPQPVAS